MLSRVQLPFLYATVHGKVWETLLFIHDRYLIQNLNVGDTSVLCSKTEFVLVHAVYA